MKISRLKNQSYTTAKSETEFNIFLYGIVGWDINVEKLWKQINEIPSGVTDLNFFMNSPGGIVQEGFALLSNIARLNKSYNTTGYIDGVAGSMMSAIAVSFGKTYASPTSEMIIHDPMAYLDIWGTYNKKAILDLMEDLKNLYTNLEVDSEVMSYPYAQKTGLTPEKVAKLWLEDGLDHFLSPKMMQEFGLIDGVLDTEMIKPAEMEEQEDEDWLFAQLQDLGIDQSKSNEIRPYRGIHEKTIAYFANKEKNSDNRIHTSGSLSHTQNKPTESMKFAKIALKLGLEPTAELDEILSAMENQESRVSKLQKDLKQSQALIETFETSKTQNEATIKDLREKLLKGSVGSVVDEVIANVTKETKGMTVNKNIRQELEGLATSHLEAKDSGDDTMAKNAKNHMELLAKTNLIPVGQNPDLSDTGTNDRKTVDGTLNLDVLKKAQAEGKARAEQERKRLNLN